MNSRKKAISILHEKKSIEKLFSVLSQRYQERNGGYTRIVKLLNRFGDNAETAVIEFVDRDLEAKGKDSGPVQVKKQKDENDTPQA